jgi:myo-inositol-1(or 4)-monophosphatase
VTEVDHLSEDLILRAIRERFPGDGILAEESGAHRAPTGRGSHGAAVGSPAASGGSPAASGGSPAASGGSPAPTSAPPAAAPRGGSNSSGGSTSTAPGRDLAHGRTWIIDPLDGTVNYANGIPYYCVSIGLADGGHPVAGVVLDPARDDLYAATADGPATLNGEPVSASAKSSLGDYVVALAVIGRGGIWRERRIARQIRISRRMGSSALSLAYVASGRFDAFVQNGGLSAWDVAAAGLIAERAGAVVTDLGGGPWWVTGKRSTTVSVVAAPAPQHGELLTLLADIGAKVQTRRP